MSEPTGSQNPDAQAQNTAKYEQVQNEGMAQQGDHQHAAAESAAPEAPLTPDQIIQQLNVALESARADADKNREALLRMAADLENTRRRNVEEVAKAHKFAIESFAEALVPVRDSMEAALNVPDQTLETIKEGVSATMRQLDTAFEKGKIQIINPVGEKFDPNKHQAVSMVPGNSVEPPVPANHVVMVLQKGYLISERVLRPALVAVAQ
ncbi:MAG: nucleotide exchange factor GrpE [Limnobacter sp.]|nr:nucleotide exchange factor GrpE [Limnobacter sp.]